MTLNQSMKIRAEMALPKLLSLVVMMTENINNQADMIFGKE